jgi:hypothetical protein
MDNPARRDVGAAMREAARLDVFFPLVLGLATLALAVSFLAENDNRSLRQRLAAAPADPALWLALAEAEKDPAALRMSILTGPREPALIARQKSLADELRQQHP